MKSSLIVFLFAASFYLSAQNKARLYSANGQTFKVYFNDRPLNKKAEASVLLENLVKDTLYLKVEFENNQRYGLTIYLMEQGRKTTHKEFDYKINLVKGKLKSVFTGMYPADSLPVPLIPPAPRKDTSFNFNNSALGHFCELKNGRILFYNNMPDTGSCKVAMPADYLTFTAKLMLKKNLESEKVDLVETICRNNCLSVLQLQKLLTYIDFELDKLKLVRIGFFSLTDTINKEALVKSFRYESSVNELHNFFRNPSEFAYKKGVSCTQASDKELLAKWTEELRAFDNDASRLVRLKARYGIYCYSPEQVSAILQLFIHDREKLEAAKLLYLNCTDKTNFMSLSTLFSYKLSVNELADFIENQKK